MQPRVLQHLVHISCIIYILLLDFELVEVINEQNKAVRAFVALPARSPLDLNLLALLLREESLDDMDASSLLHLSVAADEVRASAELPGREGNLPRVSSSLHQVLLLFIPNLLIEDEAIVSVSGGFTRVKKLHELFVVLEEDYDCPGAGATAICFEVLIDVGYNLFVVVWHVHQYLYITYWVEGQLLISVDRGSKCLMLYVVHVLDDVLFNFSQRRCLERAADAQDDLEEVRHLCVGELAAVNNEGLVSL